MTDTLQTVPSDKRLKKRTVQNTLRCILVLTLITVVCVTLLALANRFLQSEIQLDRSTSNKINELAPTGADDETAFKQYIKLVDLSQGQYDISDLDAYNKKYGNPALGNTVRALYESTHKDTGVVTRVVEVGNKGNDSVIVLLVAFDAGNAVTGVRVKSQAESYWSKIQAADKANGLFDKFVGIRAPVKSKDIAASTGATHSLDAIVRGVNAALEFADRLGEKKTAGVA